VSEAVNPKASVDGSVYDTVAVSESVTPSPVYIVEDIELEYFDIVSNVLATDDVTAVSRQIQGIVYDTVRASASTSHIPSLGRSVADYVVTGEDDYVWAVEKTRLSEIYDVAAASDYLHLSLTSLPHDEVDISDSVAISDVAGAYDKNVSASIYDGVSISEYLYGLVDRIEKEIYDSVRVSDSDGGDLYPILLEIADSVSVQDSTNGYLVPSKIGRIYLHVDAGDNIMYLQQITGATPVSTVATNPAETMALVNELRAALITLGIVE